MQSVADLDVFDAILRMIKETAVTDNRVLLARGNCKLRRDASVVTTYDFLDERDRLFAFGENA